MLDIYIVFVEPESEDNVGALARAMANFGFNKLVIVNPQVNPFSDKVRVVSRDKGWDIVVNSIILKDLEEALDLVDVSYGTTGKFSKKMSNVLRNPLTPEEVGKEIWKYDGKVGIFFGRESSGFSKEELKKFDSIITIPANEEYPIMNITHAAAIIMYELFKYRRNPIRNIFRLIKKEDKEILYKLIDDFVEVLPTQGFRKPVIRRALKNIIGKALITEREFSILAGVIRIATESIKNKK